MSTDTKKVTVKKELSAYHKTLAVNLKKLRTKMRQNQVGTAMNIGVSERTYRRYETGEYEIPSEIVEIVRNTYGYDLETGTSLNFFEKKALAEAQKAIEPIARKYNLPLVVRFVTDYKAK